jgi:hypothetical protein
MELAKNVFQVHAVGHPLAEFCNTFGVKQTSS